MQRHNEVSSQSHSDELRSHNDDSRVLRQYQNWVEEHPKSRAQHILEHAKRLSMSWRN